MTLDNPIVSPEQDLLGRSEIAVEFSSDLRDLDASHGLVVGVLGPWGSGKSSFLNLMREGFKLAPALEVIDFNPWMFSGTERLAEVFFREIAAELRLRDRTDFRRIADAFDQYSDVLTGAETLSRFRRVLRPKRGSRKTISAVPLKEDLSEALAELLEPVVIVIDDIDRLPTSDIRDTFKLVRLTASFPNVIYVLSFDRARVEAALSDPTVSGRDYLEKIIQLSFDLPVVPREALRDQIIGRLNLLLEDVPEVRFDRNRWPDVYIELVEPHLNNMRDVVRYALSARHTLRALGSEIDAVDLLALEALRVFRPEAFVQLSALRGALTDIPNGFDALPNAALKTGIDRLVDSKPDDDLLRAMVRRLFPGATHFLDNNNYAREFQAIWKTAHRVAHADFLNLYLERVVPSGIASLRRSEIAFSLFGDAQGLDSYLRSISPSDLGETISGLELYEDSFDERVSVRVAAVLMNLIPILPDRDPNGILDIIRRDIVVERVVLRLLRKGPDESISERAMRELLGRVKTYSGRLAIIRLVSPEKSESRALVDKELANRLALRLAERVLFRRSPAPADEWDLVRVINFALDETGGTLQRRFREAGEIRALFRSARSVSQAQWMDSRRVHSEARLWWDGIVRAMGGEDSVRSALRTLRADEGESDLVSLVDRYLGGWRPKD